MTKGVIFYFWSVVPGKSDLPVTYFYVVIDNDSSCIIMQKSNRNIQYLEKDFS